MLLGAKLSEYHSDYRAYSREVLQQLNWRENSDDFVFDNQFLVQGIIAGFRMGEISVPTKYFEEASSINFKRSVRYGVGVLTTSVIGFLKRLVLALQMVINAGLLMLLLSVNIPVWPAQVLTTGMLTVFNFMAYKFWVFK